MLGALGAFLGLAVVWTWPLAAYVSTRIAHDAGDPILNTWLLWWNAHVLPFSDRWWSPQIFTPMAGSLALSEHLAGLGIVATPLQLLGANPLAAYNVSLILSFGLSGFFAFALVDRLLARAGGTQAETAVRTVAAICAGLAYGFGPYRAGQLSHLQVLTSQWMPLALLAMHGFMQDGRPRWLVLLSAAWIVQALSNGYYLLFFPVLAGLWFAWFGDWKLAPSRGVTLAATLAGASLLLVPSLFEYVTVHRELGLSRSYGEMVRFSAQPGSLLQAAPMLAFWPSLPVETTEGFLFPGVTVIVLVSAAGLLGIAQLTRRSRFARSPFVFYSLAALAMWALALGPAPPDAIVPVRPYTLLTWLPGFDGLRAPARFAMLATLCISIAAGLAFARLARRFFFGPVRLALGGFAVIAGLTIDGWMRPMPLATPPGRVVLPDVPNAAVLELPADDAAVGVGSMYRAMTHGRPLINAYSGHTPPHYVILSLALRRNDSSVITELARGRPLIIIVNGRYDPDGRFQRLVLSLPGIEPRGASSAGSIFVLPATPAARIAPAGTAWPASVAEIAPERALLDLGEPRVVRTIGFPLRWHYPELGERVAIEGSLDGQMWATMWEDWTGGPALAAALLSPREAPVRLTVPDITARYVRIRPAPRWLWRELKVYGPQ